MLGELQEVNDAAKRFEEVMKRQEELHPDLKPWLVKTSFGLSLKHPMIYGMFYHPGMNAMYNEQYKAKAEYIEKRRAEKNWSGYIWMYERPYRLEKFAEIQDELNDHDYWELLGGIWSDSENLWQYGHMLGWLINSKRPGREAMMEDHEKKFLETLPDEFTVYRGHQVRNRMGYSWTLSYWRAKWFAQRFQQKRQGVVSGTVKKENIVAVLLGRNELEIVCAPKNIIDPKAIVQKAKRPEWLASLVPEFVSGFKMGRNISVHGPWHWEKVEKNALAIAKRTKSADPLVAQVFSLIHDTKRENEDDDPEHGHRSAAYAERLHKEGRLEITKDQLGLLTEACKFHNDGQISDNPTIGTCWDADRLDLTRVGIIPDPALLSTQAGKELLWRV